MHVGGRRHCVCVRSTMHARAWRVDGVLTRCKRLLVYWLLLLFLLLRSPSIGGAMCPMLDGFHHHKRLLTKNFQTFDIVYGKKWECIIGHRVEKLWMLLLESSWYNCRYVTAVIIWKQQLTRVRKILFYRITVSGSKLTGDIWNNLLTVQFRSFMAHDFPGGIGYTNFFSLCS